MSVSTPGGSAPGTATKAIRFARAAVVRSALAGFVFPSLKSTPGLVAAVVSSMGNLKNIKFARPKVTMRFLALSIAAAAASAELCDRVESGSGYLSAACAKT